MKRLAITVLVIATFAASGSALADPPWARGGDRGHGYFAHARVTSVRPILRPVVARQRVCRAYPVGERMAPDPRRAAGTLLGAMIGGVLGNTIGKGDGRAAATVAGAVLGGAIGNRVATGGDDRGYAYARTDYRRRCEVRSVVAGRRVVAYAVSYRFHGRSFRARMDHDPGRRVLVHVGREVRLAE
jgi:uncharacterized protein YcfJ